ncbi:hypothetical protein EG340_09780 [Chryseobacterium indoltheticum]|uniref:Uncharacterized protein n=1 Tax=Chryseobacterium indoltheticum TaxID=254 RepID=A0A3G6N5T5_9FLAO|nr:hypothetical protein EG340_09780 [Chryseobacterium indoltheticum]
MYRKEKFSVSFKLECIELHKNSHRSIGSIETEKDLMKAIYANGLVYITSTESRDYNREKTGSTP